MDLSRRAKKKSLWYRIRGHWQLYLLLLLPLTWYLVFSLYPMAGLQLAFKEYNAKLGFWGSKWIGMENFQGLFGDPKFMQAVWRTIGINLGSLIVSFPVPILLALMMSEVRVGDRFKKIVQPIFTFPYFLSWVVVASIIVNLFSASGLFNAVLNQLGFPTTSLLSSEKAFVPMLFLTNIWKNAGYQTIIYVAAIAGIDQTQYDASKLDGATRMQTIRYITLPNLYPTIIVLFILATGRLMSDGFDQVFNLSNAATMRVAETLDMYIYRVTFQSSMSMGYSMAVALFRSVINLLFLVITDRVSKAFTGNGLFG